MDAVTQRNSAQVEENAATAKTLEQQARAMDEQVSVNQVDATSVAGAESIPQAEATPPRLRRVKPFMQVSAAA